VKQQLPRPGTKKNDHKFESVPRTSSTLNRDPMFDLLPRAKSALKGEPMIETLPRSRCTLKQTNATYLKTTQRNPT